MIFIETEIFTQEVTKLLNDDEYAGLQVYMALNPDCGDLIQESGGLRKVRWGSRGKGKRGGVRVIYFYHSHCFEIRMLLIYQKGIKDDMTAQEKTVLRKLIEGW